MEVEGSGEAAAHDGGTWAGPLSTPIRRLPSVGSARAWLALRIDGEKAGAAFERGGSVELRRWADWPWTWGPELR